MKVTTLALPSRAKVLGEDAAWTLLRALAAAAARGAPALEGTVVTLDETGALCCAPEQQGVLAIREDREHGYEPQCTLDARARALLDLYLPLCTGPASTTLCLAHLGQSLDGRLATVTGSSRFVTGPEDVLHTHRLRALFDAVVVGVQTAIVDDPQLTTRLVPGLKPARVVLDPQARLPSHLRLLRDGAAPTVVVTARGARHARRGWGSHVELLEVACRDGLLDPQAVLEGLRDIGLSRIFVEGGGITVSHFLQARALDRLHVAIAPKIIGSGTPALQLAPIARIADAITAARCRRFLLGADVLFDCELRADRT